MKKIKSLENSKFLKSIESTFIKTYQSLLLPKNITLGIAFSGGPDSSCLLYLLHKLKNYLKIKDIKILYFNHLLRGKESEKEEKFVKDIAKKYGYELIIGYPKTKPPKKNIEAWARQERYNFFKNVKSNLNIDYIALGHNLTDLAETIILKLIKGTFLEGLKGFYPKRDFYIRPLIEIRKEDIEKYLKIKNIPYFIDSSNLETKYERNFLRHKIFPLLKNLNPSLEKTLLNFSKNMLEFLDFYKNILNSYLKKALKKEKNKYFLDRKILLSYPDYLKREIINLFAKNFLNTTLSSKTLFEIQNLIKKYKNIKRAFGKTLFIIDNNKIYLQKVKEK